MDYCVCEKANEDGPMGSCTNCRKLTEHKSWQHSLAYHIDNKNKSERMRTLFQALVFSRTQILDFVKASEAETLEEIEKHAKYAPDFIQEVVAAAKYYLLEIKQADYTFGEFQQLLNNASISDIDQFTSMISSEDNFIKVCNEHFQSLSE